MKIKEGYRLRKPGGPHPVGCVRFSCEYSLSGKRRTIPCLCFYPADSAEGSAEKYAHPSVLPGAEKIETNSHVGAPLLNGRHPFLLYNHGYGSHCESNTVQSEELASRGYIVLSIGHEGEGTYELPNGDILAPDEKLTADFSADAAKFGEIFVKYTSWLRGDGRRAGMEAHREQYRSILARQPRMAVHMDAWVRDGEEVLDRVLNSSEIGGFPLGDHIDQGHIGAFGMSFGGAAALRLSHCGAVKAAADLDGFYYSSAWEKPFSKPILLMQSDGASVGGLLTFPYLNAEGGVCLATFKNSTHLNFTDFSEIALKDPSPKNGGFMELGDIDPALAENCMNALLVDFFDANLRGRASEVIVPGKVPRDIKLIKK